MYGNELAAKLSIPKTHHKILPRNDISKTLDASVPDKAVCIVAPYGCGKTLAVTAWLRERDRTAAWLSLDAGDNEEQVFLDDLTAAVLPLVSDGAYDFRADARYIEQPRAFLLEQSAMTAHAGGAKTLVLDNFTHIRDIGLQRFVRDFISACLGDWTIIIISREELPPVFNDLMLKGRISLITLNDLHFSPDEIAEYLSVNEHAFSRQDILRMSEATEGWPAALNVALTVSRDGQLEYGESAQNYVRGFFEAEIWDGLEDGIRDFLLKTSILDKLTPSSCHAVTGIGATAPVIDRLVQNGLFISKLGEKGAYRYHRVFQIYLQTKLAASGIDEKQLYMKYAWWLFERGEYKQSFTYFFKAGDLYGVRQALKMLDLADMGIEGFLERVGCITQLNAGELKQYPEIVAIMALVHYLRGEVPRMQELVHILLQWLEPGQLPISAEEYAEYRWEVGWLCYLDPGQNHNDTRHIEHSNYRHYVPHLKELHMSRYAVLSFPSYFRGIRDYGNDYIFSFDAFLARMEGGENTLIDEEEVRWLTYLISAEYEYELEHFAKAEEIVRRIMPLVEDRRYTYLYFICTALLVRLARAAGNPGEIDALTARLESMIIKNGHHFLMLNFRALELRNRLAAGGTGFTTSFMDENRELMDKPHIYLLYRQIAYVRGLLSTGGYSEAIILLGNLALMCEKYNRPTDLIEVDILRAVASYKLGQQDAAQRHLTVALSAAKKYGYIRLFADDAKDVLPILTLPRKRRAGDKYVQNVIISCKKALTRTGQRVSADDNPRTELTKTELKILRCLQTGMSYEEIALDNNISVSTVKSHAHSVYLKLDVSNRTSAVMAAQKLGLL